jgi:hypothetical protein
LVHGAEVVLLIEIEHNSPRVAEYEEETSHKAREEDVDALDEARDEVMTKVSAYKQKEWILVFTPYFINFNSDYPI